MGATLAQTSTSDVDWRSAAVKDIEAAYIEYRDNHPGWFDPNNPGFREKLASARAEGLKYAQRADSRDTYAKALGAFSSVLGDGHAVVYPNDVPGKENGDPLSPGFVLAWRGGEALVHSVDAGFSVPVGSRAVSCDGKPFRQFVREETMALGFRPDEAGQWWELVPYVVDSTTTAVKRTSRCTFIRPDGVKVEQRLDWHPIPNDYYARRRAASDGDRKAIGLSEPKPGIYWIGMPDFQPNDEGQAAYAKLYQDIAARHDELKQARAIVLDLRHNNGGSSSWSRDVARALWGKDAVDRRMFDFFSDVTIWHRASDNNLAHVRKFLEEYRNNKEISEHLTKIRDGMVEARKRNEEYYVARDSAQEIAEGLAKSPLTDFNTPIYVIIPGRCASACLDAVDTFTRFDPVTLIGAPTAADTTYMDVRGVDLPSGQGKMAIPIKFWHNRPRASGQFYYPRIRVDDLDWSSANFLRLIEKDLAKSN